jgi:hypothetical protein
MGGRRGSEVSHRESEGCSQVSLPRLNLTCDVLVTNPDDVFCFLSSGYQKPFLRGKAVGA